MNDPFRTGIECAKRVDASAVVDKLSRSAIELRASSTAVLLTLGLFFGSAADDVDELLKAMETEAGVLENKEEDDGTFK